MEPHLRPGSTSLRRAGQRGCARRAVPEEPEVKAVEPGCMQQQEQDGGEGAGGGGR